MKLHELKPTPGSTHYRKRLGRGCGSGLGKTGGRGENGQLSRSGGGKGIVFEGGQTPLYKRIAKRGFTNPFRKEFATVNVYELNNYEAGTVVDPELLLKDGLVKKVMCGVKILGDGELTVSLTVRAHKVTESAKKKIEAAGGTVEVI